MPATRPRASFEPIPPDFDLKALVEATPNFSYVDRISVDMIDQQGLAAFEKLVLLHVVIGGKPLVIDGFEDRLDPWTFTPKWLRDNCGEKQENSRNLTAKETLPLTIGHYLKNMGMLTNQFFSKPGAYKETKRQRVYLKDIDCPPVWHDKLKEHIPSALFYLNDSTGEVGGPGAVPDPNSNASGRRLGKGIARAGDLMSSLPPDMRAENLMCYIGHEGTYTPAHREMCASLGQNIMVGASGTVSEDGKPERPGSSIWFMTESKDRHTVSEYWLSVLGHDIEVENHFAQVVAWKKAPFNVYVVEQRPGDFILIPPLAPHQVWNRGTRTMKVAWNRTTVETLEMALNEALPRSRIVCRDEQYKNKAIVYYTLQKYSSLLSLAQSQASRMPQDAAQQLLYSSKVKALGKDFRRLFNMYKQVILSEMFSPDDRDNPKSIEYLPFDSNVTCAYCRGNIFNRFLSCPSCKDLLGHHADDTDGDPYDVCMDCYAMGRSCACVSGLKWVEQFRWKELAAKYESWRKLIISLDGGQVTDKTPLPILEERKRYGKKTLAEVCKEQLKRRPFKDVKKPNEEPKDDEDEEEEIVVDDNGTVKKIQKKKSKAWLKNNNPCHVCQKRHPNWKMAHCNSCERWWCYGTLFRGWDKMPAEIMEDQDWTCPHCLGICFAGACRKDPKMQPYEPKGTLLGHDTRKVADARSVEALVDFSVSNLNWLREDDTTDRTASKRIRQAGAEAQRAKALDPTLDADDEQDAVDQSNIQLEYSPEGDGIDPALGGGGAARRESDYEDDDSFAHRLQQANSALPPPAAMVAGAPVRGNTPEGYAAVSQAGYVPPAANMYPQPEDAGRPYNYPGAARAGSAEPMDASDEELGQIRPFKRRRTQGGDVDGEFEDVSMTKHPKAKKPRLSAAGFRSSDLADAAGNASKAKNEAQRQFEKENERKSLEKAKAQGRFIMLQAALKGKRRIVKLPIRASRLAQLVAQQAAKAALTAGEDADAEHEVEEGAAQQEPEEEPEGNDDILLKSDIQPKKTKDPKTYYQQRQQEGYVVSGQTKKARIPVEKDDNYRLGGSGTVSKPRTSARPGATDKRIPPRSRKNVEYEEVDIGSDDDDFDDDLMFVSSGPRGNERRTLPSYLQNRHVGDENFPDELPSSRRDSGKQRAPRPEPKPTNATSTPSQSQTAGKRPAMRPSLGSTTNAAIEVTSDHEEDEEDEDAAAQAAIDAAANGGCLDVDEAAGHAAATGNSTPATAKNGVNSGSARGSAPGSAAKTKGGGRPRGRPSRNNMAKLQRQKVEEQNRLAKLSALEGEEDFVCILTRPSFHSSSHRASSRSRVVDDMHGNSQLETAMYIHARTTRFPTRLARDGKSEIGGSCDVRADRRRDDDDIEESFCSNHTRPKKRCACHEARLDIQVIVADPVAMPEGSKPLLESQGSQTRFNMSQKMEGQKRKKVLIVGAGAAGMSCAHHLSNHPDRFDVTLVDAVDYCGGQAYSIPLNKEKTGASWLNQGVQGGSYIFHHTLTMFARNGFWADPVNLQVSFGKGDQFWTNVYPTKMLEKHAKEVVRFFRMLKIVRALEVFFALMPIKYLVKIFRFSEEFANIVALPMVALFLGTGNWTPEVPSMVLERLCTSPTYGMWHPPDKASLVSNLPPMVVFPNFSEFYETWRKNLVSRGVNIRLSTEVTRVLKRDKNGVKVNIIKRTRVPDGHNPNSAWVPDDVEGSKADPDAVEHTEEYDEIVLATLTDTAKRLLDKTATGMEKRVLGSAKFANDITVTHQDAEYMKRHYENFYSKDLAVEQLNGVDQSKRNAWAKENFKAMYLIRMYPQDLTKLEMCFDCTNYQAQFPPEVPFEKHVFQTIFLNKERDGHLWTLDEIDESKIIRKDWWHQLCHSFTHYLFVVPWLMFLQGKRCTRFAGSWTLVNAHEVAVLSGISAAVNLGASYPEDLERDKFAFLAFRLYYLLVYGRWYKRVATKTTTEGEGKDWATGNEYGSFYDGPGVNAKEERRMWKQEVQRGRSLESW